MSPTPTRRGTFPRRVIVLALASTLGAFAGFGFRALPASAEGPGMTAPSAGREGRSLAVLVTLQGADATTLHLVRPGAASGPPSPLGAAVASVPHPPLATVRAATLGDAALAVVDEATRGDRSFGSALHRLRPGEAPARLVDAVVHASRPLPHAATGEVLISRGEVGFGAGGARDDRLRIDAVTVATGRVRTVARSHGNLLFLAGIAGGEVVLYRIDGAGAASLVATDLATGRERTVLASMPPFARDFSVDTDGRTVVFQNRHATDPARWVVDAVDLRDGRSMRLHEDSSMQLAPHLWPDGSLALTRRPDQPLERFDVGQGLSAPGLRGLPRGVARVASVSPGGAWVAVSSAEVGGLPRLSLVQTSTGHAGPIALPANARATVAGFIDTRGGFR